jgi:hypothetical protein
LWFISVLKGEAGKRSSWRRRAHNAVLLFWWKKVIQHTIPTVQTAVELF